MPKQKPQQLWYQLYNSIPQELMPIAVSHVGNINRYLLKHNISVKHKRTLLYNVTLVLLGYIDNQTEETIILAYNVMKETEYYAIKSKQGSSTAISARERAIREHRKENRERQINNFKRGIPISSQQQPIRKAPPKSAKLK